jgi:hypothetical protein
LSVPVLSWLLVVGGARRASVPARPEPVPPPVRLCPEGRRQSSSRSSLSEQGSPHPTLRANPYPEVTDLFCRLPLPTLFYSTRGCSPWRPDAVMGTTESENHSLPQVFTGRRERIGQYRERTALPTIKPYLRAIRFQGNRLLKRKENSSRGSRQRPWVRLRCRTSYPDPGSGILT